MNNSEKKLFNKLLEEARDLAEANNRPIGIYLDKKIKEIGTTAAWRLQIENRPGSSCCCRTPRRICML